MRPVQMIRRFFQWCAARRPPDDVMFTKRYRPEDALHQGAAADFYYAVRKRT